MGPKRDSPKPPQSGPNNLKAFDRALSRPWGQRGTRQNPPAPTRPSRTHAHAMQPKNALGEGTPGDSQGGETRKVGEHPSARGGCTPRQSSDPPILEQGTAGWVGHQSLDKTRRVETLPPGRTQMSEPLACAPTRCRQKTHGGCRLGGPTPRHTPRHTPRQSSDPSIIFNHHHSNLPEGPIPL